MKQYKCYLSFVVKLLSEHGFQTEMENFQKELDEEIRNAILKNNEESEEEFPDDLNDFKVFDKNEDDGMLNKRNLRRCRKCKELRTQLYIAWGLDRDTILKFIRSTTSRVPYLPNLDGFFGGQPCRREYDKHEPSKKFRG